MIIRRRSNERSRRGAWKEYLLMFLFLSASVLVLSIVGALIGALIFVFV